MSVFRRFFKTPFHSDLFQRLVVHSIALTFLVLLLYTAFDTTISWILGIFASLCVAVGTYEYATMAKHRLHYPYRVYSAFGSFFFILISFLSIRWGAPALLSWMALFVWIIINVFVSRKHPRGALESSAITLFAIVYVSIPIHLFLHILYGFMHTQVPSLGVWWASFLIATTKGSDIFGYFFGKAFGVKKISPHISPNKTVVGFMFGCLGSILISILFFFHIPQRFPGYVDMPFIIILLGFILGVSGFFGDILESVFKREAKLKNSNHIRAVGGMLDTLDSLLLSAPILYFILSITQQGKFLG